KKLLQVEWDLGRILKVLNFFWVQLFWSAGPAPDGRRGKGGLQAGAERTSLRLPAGSSRGPIGDSVFAEFSHALNWVS
ncbi:MAG TPA: hypothetical protein QF533_12150, partial [Nitrospinota bacterium]|nr:hypothetical protein [Nitrospinota bacterium]